MEVVLHEVLGPGSGARRWTRGMKRRSQGFGGSRVTGSSVVDAGVLSAGVEVADVALSPWCAPTRVPQTAVVEPCRCDAGGPESGSRRLCGQKRQGGKGPPFTFVFRSAKPTSSLPLSACVVHHPVFLLTQSGPSFLPRTLRVGWHGTKTELCAFLVYTLFSTKSRPAPPRTEIGS